MIIGVIPGMALLYLGKFHAIMNIKLENFFTCMRHTSAVNFFQIRVKKRPRPKRMLNLITNLNIQSTSQKNPIQSLTMVRNPPSIIIG